MSEPRRQSADADRLFGGTGMMGDRMRQLDWSSTPLGPVETWPQSLRTAVRIMLTSRYAMWMLWGPEYTFFCNDTYLPTVGVKESWVLGSDSRKVWQEIWPDIGPRIDHVLRSGESTWDEGLLLFLQRSGYPEETYHTFSYSPLSDDDGTVRGMLCVVTEETERVISERRLTILRELASGLGTTEEDVFAAASDGVLDGRDLPFGEIYLWNSDTGTFDLASSGGSALTHHHKWPLKEAFDRNESLVVDLPHNGFPRGRWEIAPSKAMLIPIAQPGQTTPAGVFVAGLNPFRPLDNAYRSFISLFVGQIASGLGNARAYAAERKRAAALAEIDRAKTAFFSNVSHEFRTPLTLMLGPVEDVLKSGHLNGGEHEQLTLVHRNGLRLLKLVNTLLAFSRIESGRVQASFEPIDLAHYTADLASVFRSAMEKAGLKFTTRLQSFPEPVYVDRDMWEKIVLNLLSNAFKFTLQGEVEISLKQQDGSAVLTVRDTGSGIPAHELPHLFERFHRVEGTKGRTHEGTGIGLALVQEFVKLHHGEIVVYSEPEKGTTFEVILPLGKAHLPPERIFAPRTSADVGSGATVFAEEAMRWLPSSAEDQIYTDVSGELEATSPAGPLNRERIVLADDNADMREYVTKLLNSKYEVTAVADGEQAYRAIQQNRPSVVLSDVMMPNLDGFGLLKTLRDDPELRTLPIILLSARAGEEATIEGMHAGADDYLVKPFSARELLARVEAQIQRAKFERVLRESEERFRNIADSAPAMLWITDGTGCCTYLSRGWYEYTGQNPGHGLGHGWFDAVHPDDRDAAQQTYRNAHAEQQGYSVDYRVRRADGSYCWVLDQGQPRFDESGEFAGFIGSVLDIDARKRVEAELLSARQREQAVLSAAEIGYWSWNLATDEVEIDANFAALQGYEPPGPRVVPFEEIMSHIHREDIGIIRKSVDSSVSAEQFVVPDHRYVRLDGDIRWIAGRGFFTKDAKDVVIQGEGIVIDITARKLLELQLEKALVSERSAREEAERINRLKDEFLATLSHELRTPLNAILGWAQILTRKKGVDAADLDRGLTAIERNARAQTQMIEDLLDMSRIISGKVRLDFRAISPADVVEQAMQSVLPTASNKGVELIKQFSADPIVIKSDPARLQQVVWNLLTNAIKFTPGGGKVTVSVQQQGSKVEIKVEDSGEGISPSFLPFMFERFRQADGSTTRKHGGLGLGLSIAKNLIELHGGSIHAHSDGEGKGAVFTIRLPVLEFAHRDEDSIAGGSKNNSPLTSRLAGAKVLVVDDDPDARELVRRILLERDADVVLASSASEAIDRLSEDSPALLVSDIAMPEQDGYEFIRQVRSLTNEIRSVPAVAMTAFARTEDRQRALQAGFQVHVAKPLDPDELLAACESLMDKVVN